MSNPSNPSSTDLFLHLPDGRQLCFAEYGAPSGYPVLFFHGAPGSRRQIHADMAATAAQRGVRLIAPERPGYGLSDAQPERSLQDWAADMAALTDALGVGRFSVVGFSAGGVYALACAHAMPAQVDRVALAGGLAPADVPGIMDERTPELNGLYALAHSDFPAFRQTLASLAPTPAGLLATMIGLMGDWDKGVVIPRSGEFEADFTETLRQGIDSIARDMLLVSRPWGFSPADIQAETHLWHGTADRNAPPAMADYLASTLPNSRKFMLPGEGHFSLFAHWDEILARLL